MELGRPLACPQPAGPARIPAALTTAVHHQHRAKPGTDGPCGVSSRCWKLALERHAAGRRRRVVSTFRRVFCTSMVVIGFENHDVELGRADGSVAPRAFVGVGAAARLLSVYSSIASRPSTPEYSRSRGSGRCVAWTAQTARCPCSNRQSRITLK